MSERRVPPSHRGLPRCTLLLWLPALLLLAPAGGSASELDVAAAEWSAGNVNSAVIRLKGLLQTDPDDAAARLLLGQVYLGNGDAAAAAQELERARTNGAADIDVLPPLIEALLAQRELARVMELTETGPDTPPALLVELLALRGAALLLAGDPQAAGAAFQKAGEADPTAVRPLLGLATLALRDGDPGRARALIDQVLEIAPEQADGWTALGALEYRNGHFPEAAAAYDQALKFARGKWPIHYQRGLALLETKEPRRAWDDAKAVRDAAPGFPGLRYLDGRLLLIDGKTEQALEQLEQYLRAAPQDGRAIYFAALALHLLGRNAQAEEYLTRLRASHPDSANAALLLAKVRLDTGDAAGAEQVLAPFAARDDASLAALELMRRAVALQGRAEEAAALIARAAARYPDVASAQVAQARMLQLQGEPGAAADILRRVTEQTPDDEQARMLLIRAELLAGNTAAAKAETDAFAEQAPDSVLAITARAAMLSQQGDTEGARDALVQALAIDPGFERAALALAALELGDQRVDAARKVLDDLLARDPGSTNAVLVRAAIERRESGPAAYVDQIRSGLDAAPDNLRLRTILAQWYLRQREAEKSLQVLSQAPAAQADDPALMLLRARAESAAGHPDLASKTLARLAEINPQSAEVRYLQAAVSAAAGDTGAIGIHLSNGLVLDQRQVLEPDRLAAIIGRLDDAGERERLVRDLLRTAPEHPAVIDVNARYAVQRREFDRAIDALAGLHRDHPDAEVYLLDLAEALDAAGRKPQARATLQDWIGDHPQAMRPRLLLAQMQLEAGDTAAATAQYQAVVAADDRNAIALNNLAMLLAEVSPREARDYAERALKLRPADPAFLDTMGTVLLALGEAGQARELLAKAHAGTPDPGIAFRYAKALAETGDRGAARRVLLQTQTQSFPEKAAAEALYLELAQGR